MGDLTPGMIESSGPITENEKALTLMIVELRRQLAEHEIANSQLTAELEQARAERDRAVRDWQEFQQDTVTLRDKLDQAQRDIGRLLEALQLADDILSERPEAYADTRVYGVIQSALLGDPTSSGQTPERLDAFDPGLLQSCLNAVRDWQRDQREQHPESVDGWYLEERLVKAIAATSGQPDAEGVSSR